MLCVILSTNWMKPYLELSWSVKLGLQCFQLDSQLFLVSLDCVAELPIYLLLHHHLTQGGTT